MATREPKKSVNTKAATQAAVVRFNKEAGGIEVVFPDGRRLSSEEKGILKSLGFAWHRRNGYYYTHYTDEKYELVKASFLGKDSVLPAKIEQKVMAEIAAEARARREAKRAEQPKRNTSAAKVDALEAKVDALTDAMTNLVKALTPQAAGK